MSAAMRLDDGVYKEDIRYMLKILYTAGKLTEYEYNKAIGKLTMCYFDYSRWQQ